MLEQQGHDTYGLRERLDRVPNTYDSWFAFAHELTDVPLRQDFPYVEPNDLASTVATERDTRISALAERMYQTSRVVRAGCKA
jgi:hypothetical protein